MLFIKCKLFSLFIENKTFVTDFEIKILENFKNFLFYLMKAKC